MINTDHQACEMLHNIYAVAQSDNPEDRLVSTPSGEGLYHSACGFGKILSGFYWISKPFGGEEREKRALTKGMERAEKLARQILEQQRHTLTEIKKHFICVLQSQQELKEKDYLKLVRSFQEIDEQFYAYFRWKFKNAKTSKKNIGLLSDWSHCRRIVKLEMIFRGVQSAVPFETLVSIACGEKKIVKEALIHPWIRKANQLSIDGKITARFFHKALSSILFYIPTERKSLAYLEHTLIQEKCILLTQEDEVHLKWRSHLKKGSSILCNKTKITLGRQLGGKTDADRTLVFTVQKNRKVVVWIGSNCVELGIRALIHQADQGAFRAVQIWEVDAQGTCALVARASKKLPTLMWNTLPSSTQINPLDKASTKPLIEGVRHMLERDEMPEGFDENSLRYTAEGTLVCIKTVEKMVPLNTSSLEKILYTASTENLSVFSYLMRTSGLHQHPHNRYFYYMFEKGITHQEGEPSEEHLVAATQGISSEEIIQQGKVLYQKARSLKKTCRRREELRKNPLPSKTVQKIILKTYKEVGIISGLQQIDLMKTLKTHVETSLEIESRRVSLWIRFKRYVSQKLTAFQTWIHALFALS
jgi:hypothetical protein